MDFVWRPSLENVHTLLRNVNLESRWNQPFMTNSQKENVNVFIYELNMNKSAGLITDGLPWQGLFKPLMVKLA